MTLVKKIKDKKVNIDFNKYAFKGKNSSYVDKFISLTKKLNFDFL